MGQVYQIEIKVTGKINQHKNVLSDYKKTLPIYQTVITIPFKGLKDS